MQPTIFVDWKQMPDCLSSICSQWTDLWRHNGLKFFLKLHFHFCFSRDRKWSTSAENSFIRNYFIAKHTKFAIEFHKIFARLSVCLIISKMESKAWHENAIFCMYYRMESIKFLTQLCFVRTPWINEKENPLKIDKNSSATS